MTTCCQTNDVDDLIWQPWSSRGFLLLADHRWQCARNFENGLAGATHRAKFAEDGQTDGTNESDVNQLPVAEAGSSVVDLSGRGQA